MTEPPTVASHYALLIGIDSYPERPLEGCVRDVHEIGQFLKQAINPLSIQTLIAPQHDEVNTSYLSSDVEIHPTYKVVTAHLRSIHTTAKAGDHVYIHFSGHGTKTEPDDEFSDQSTGDLALVLLDEEGKTVNFLSGPKLARYFLHPMVQKGLIVTLVLDCCFSASVYRHDSQRTRFLPYKLHGVKLGQNDSEFAENVKGNGDTSEQRDASMRLNWLMNPDRYAILTACGPDHEGGEIRTHEGISYGKLSYFLLQSFQNSGGCHKTHAAISRYLCAVFQGHKFQQNPVLYGRKDQGFFGKVVVETSQSIHVVKNQAGELQLLAGRAHGFCKGDRFLLNPVIRASAPEPKEDIVIAEIVHLGGLSSILETSDTAVVEGQGMWTARVLLQSSLQQYSIHVHHDVPDIIRLKAALSERFLTIDEVKSPLDAFYITSGKNQSLEVHDEQGHFLARFAALQVREKIEHLVRFTMVKNLANINSGVGFQKRFRIYIRHGIRYLNAEELIAVRHEDILELVLENFGPTTLFFSIYNMGPSWQIQNLLQASYLEIPAPQNAQKPTRRSRKLKMIVPETMRGDDTQTCDDYFKIFVTLQPSLFDLLELPKLGQPMTTQHPGRSDTMRVASVRDQSEQWASVTFHISISM